MPGHQNGDRSALVVATEWVSRVTAVSFEMVLPAAFGHWLDGKWNTSPWLVVLGACLGFYVAMRHLLQLSSDTGNKNQANRSGKQQ